MNAEDDGEFGTALDTYRDRVSKPLLRLFREYGVREWQWLVLGLTTSVLTYGALLVTPIALGTTYENARASGKRICGLMDVPVRIENAPNPVPLADVDGRVEYDGVTFGYEGEETVLDGVNFVVEVGETVALVGATGAGKSTVARDRQEFLQQTTNNGIDAGVHHRSLIPYLYQDFPVDHPVLATVATLDDTCQECQRTVRDHLVRRA